MKIKLTRKEKLDIIVPAAILGVCGAAAVVASTLVYKNHLATNRVTYTQFLDAMIEETRVFHERALDAKLPIQFIESVTK